MNGSAYRLTRISVPVTVAEREMIRACAADNLRHPRDQARYFLQMALGLVGDVSQHGNTPADNAQEIEQ